MEISEMKRKIMEKLKEEKPNPANKKSSIDRLAGMVKMKERKDEAPEGSRLEQPTASAPSYSGDDAALKLQALEREKKNLESKLSQLKIEIDAKNRRVDEAERLYNESNETVKNMMLRLEPLEREKKNMEARVSQLKRELESAEKRHEGDKAELDAIKAKSEARDKDIERDLEAYGRMMTSLSELSQRAKVMLAKEG